MRVLVLTPFFPHASEATYGCFVSEPIPRLRALGVECDVIAVRPFYRGAAAPHPGAPRAQWLRFFQFPGHMGLASAGRLLKLQLARSARLDASGFDLIHAHAALPCGQAASLLAEELGIPFVVTVHGLDVCSTHRREGLAARWCRRASAEVFRRARLVLCVSERVAIEVGKVLEDRERIRVVYNGFDPELFAPGLEMSGASVVLSVGNLTPIKGHETVLRAVAALRRRHPGLRYEIIGEGPERGRLGALARELGVEDRVIFRGLLDRRGVAEAMRRCSVFALPSSYEALGCVYLEAMAVGKAVIACDGQGIAEIIRHGHNGWLVPPGDQRALDAALDLLLSDPPLRRRLGSHARRTVLQDYTLDHQAAALNRAYRESLDIPAAAARCKN